MKEVYLLEDGSYSDYHVIGVFTDRKKAKVVQQKVGGDIRPVSLNPGFEDINAGRLFWRVLMLRDGGVERVDVQDPSGYDLAGSVTLWRRTQAPAYKGKGIPDALHATVWATDQKHAIKIVNEIRAQMIADGRWK